MHQKLEDYTEPEIIEGLKNDDEMIARYLRKKYLPIAIGMAYSWKKDLATAEMLLHDTIMHITKKAKANDYKFEDKFDNYFHRDLRGRFQNLWTKDSKDNNYDGGKGNQNFEESYLPIYLIPESEKLKRINKCKAKLPKQDQLFLDMVLDEECSSELIMHHFGFKNKDFIRLKKHRIIQKIKKCLGLIK